MLAKTWVESVRCRPPAVPPSTLPTLFQEQIQQTLLGIALNQAGAKLRKHGVIKPRVCQLQAECVFPSQSITHGVSGLAIGQAFQKLEEHHQRHPPRSPHRGEQEWET